MPRMGLTRETVVEAALGIVETEGRSALSLARVADDLGVKAPSLYSHVDGLAGLENLVTLRGLDMLIEVCRSSVMGRSGPDALRRMAFTYREFAVAHPDLYLMTQQVIVGDDRYAASAGRLLDPVLAILSGMALSGDDLIHAARFLRSALHGFATLESGSGFGIDIDLDASFEWLVSANERALASFMPADFGPRQPSPG
jgi:AcrR family transcriptional regulator